MLKAPFPYFGGKSRVAAEVWSRFGDVRNYVEPFFGSGAVLLGRPLPFDGVETVNDMDGVLVNFWRALKADPHAVAEIARHQASEIDLTARHNWVFENKARVLAMQRDPCFFDVQAAAYWLYSRSAAVSTRGLFAEKIGSRRPRTRPNGIFCDMAGLSQRLTALRDRLESVHVLCGEWHRVVTDACLLSAGFPAAVFLDPPYQSSEVNVGIYEHFSDVLGDVVSWCHANGNDSRLRIALCAYEGIEMPADWDCHQWSSYGGHSIVRSRGSFNRHRERIWFSPHCLSENQGRLF
jgi:DNA adenine methylase